MADNVVTGMGAELGSPLTNLLMADSIQPGDTPSYEVCRSIYLYHPMGEKLVSAAVSMAMSQKRDINIADSPETAVTDAFIKTWRALKCDATIKSTMILSHIYGASALVYGSDSAKPADPINYEEFQKGDVWFNVLDPLNTSGSFSTNQDPNSPQFQKVGNIVSQGKIYHRSRGCVIFNEQPIYISFTGSAFGYAGRSVYQRALYPLKSFINTMRADDSVSEKAGLLIVKSKKPGSIVDNIMQQVAGIKRSMLKGARTGNILEIGLEDAIESLNLQNVNSAMETSRDNIIANVALAAGIPAIFLTEESLSGKTLGSEGTEDAKRIASYIDGYRERMQPLYDFMDRLVMWKAWTPEFYETIRAQYPEYKNTSYEAATTAWRRSFTAEWPNLLEEPDSEKIKVEEIKFKAVNEAVAAIKDELDPENKAALFAWMADSFNENTLLFPSPLELDFDAMIAWQQEEKEKIEEIEGAYRERDGEETASADSEHWITVEGGQHVLVDGDGQVLSGMGGKENYQHWSGIKSKSGDVDRAPKPRFNVKPEKPKPAPKEKEKQTYHPAISSYASELTEGGGISYIFDEHGKITGRTPSVNPDWYKDNAFIVFNKKGDEYQKAPSVREIKEAVKAHENGDKTTGKQDRILRALSDMAEADEEFNRAELSEDERILVEFLNEGVINGAIDNEALHGSSFDELMAHYKNLYPSIENEYADVE